MRSHHGKGAFDAELAFEIDKKNGLYPILLIAVGQGPFLFFVLKKKLSHIKIQNKKMFKKCFFALEKIS